MSMNEPFHVGQALTPHEIVARLIDEAGGELIGESRLQNVACLARIAGHLTDFDFEYYNYGPFSRQMARATWLAIRSGAIKKTDIATHLGWTSVYRNTDTTPTGEDENRRIFVAAAAKIDIAVLDLVATAALLHCLDISNSPSYIWEETVRLKPKRAWHGRLEQAELAYAGLMRLPSPRPLPAIVGMSYPSLEEPAILQLEPKV